MTRIGLARGGCANRAGAAVLVAAVPSPAARAHGGELDWHAPPSDSLLVLLPLLLATTLYLAGMARRMASAGLQPHEGWRSAAFSAAIVLLVAALVWPLDAWAGQSFAAHMVQHMVLVALAPPLLLAGRPAAVMLRGLPVIARSPVLQPRRWPGAAALRSFTAGPGAMAVLHGGLLWAWHAPLAFELALRSDFVHWLEHLTLLGSAMLFWRALLRARADGAGWAMLAMLVTIIHSGMLGALLALAPHPLYATYARQSGAAAALADQQLAGLVMWVPMGAVYLLLAVIIAARTLGPEAAPEVDR